MRMLYPEADGDIDPVAAYSVDRPAPADRPWLLTNMIASVDGATALDGVSGGLGGDPDRAVFAAIREVADLILVAGGTVRAESYGPPKSSDDARARRVARGQAPDPRLAVVTASLNLDPAGDLFTGGGVTPLIITAAQAPAEPRRRLEDVAEVVTAGIERVDLAAALASLADTADVVLSEGGPSLLGQLATDDLIDELCLTLAPAIAGGSSKRFVHGAELDKLTGLDLAHVLESEGMLFLRYSRSAETGDGTD